MKLKIEMDVNRDESGGPSTVNVIQFSAEQDNGSTIVGGGSWYTIKHGVDPGDQHFYEVFHDGGCVASAKNFEEALGAILVNQIDIFEA